MESKLANSSGRLLSVPLAAVGATWATYFSSSEASLNEKERKSGSLILQADRDEMTKANSEY